MHEASMATGSPLFDSLSQGERDEVGRNMTASRYEAGQTIFRRGEPGDRLFVIEQGVVEISSSGGGETAVIARFGRGDCFGEMSLLTGEPRSADAVAATAVDVLVLRQADFVKALTTCPALSRNIGRILSERLQRSTDQLLHRGRKGDLTILGGLPGSDEAGLLALNIAVSLARQSRRRVLLVLDTASRTGRAAEAFCADRPDLAILAANRDLLRLHQQGDGNEELGGLTVVAADRGGGEAQPAALATALEWLREVYDHMVFATDLGGGPRRPLPLAPGDRLVGIASVEGEHWSAALGAVSARFPGTENRGLVLAGEAHANGESPAAGPTAWPVRRSLALGRGLLAGTTGRPIVLAEPGAKLSKDLAWLARDIGGLKVGLALGAGGAKGYALLGALKVLEAQGVPFDFLAGTSIGSVIGAWLASGLPVDEVQRLTAESFDPEAVKKIFAVSLSGFSTTGSQEMATLLERSLGDREFSDLPIPLVVMAVDLRTRREVALCEGMVRRAVHASISLPGTFPPLEVEDKLLVDGVTLNPVPSGPLRALGADVVIAVNLISREQLPTWPGEDQGPAPVAPRRGIQMLDSLFQVMDIMQTETSERCAAQADVAITPLFGPCSWRDFDRAAQFMEAGALAARRAEPALRHLLPWIE